MNDAKNIQPVLKNTISRTLFHKEFYVTLHTQQLYSILNEHYEFNVSCVSIFRLKYS